MDDTDPVEIDRQAAHLFKHDSYGIDDIYEIWNSDPMFYPAKPPAHWLMVADIAGDVLLVPLAPSDHDDSTDRKCRAARSGGESRVLFCAPATADR